MCLNLMRNVCNCCNINQQISDRLWHTVCHENYYHHCTDVWCWLRITDWETDYYHHNNHYISHPQCGCGGSLKTSLQKYLISKTAKGFFDQFFSRCKLVLAHYIFFPCDKIWWGSYRPRVPIISKYLTWVKFLHVQTAGRRGGGWRAGTWWW